MAVADDYEQALRETDQLRQDLMRMEGLLSGHREHEKSLQTTLITAQKLADDIKATAEDEGRRIVREAQGRSDLLLEKTQARLEDIQREIDGLKLKRRDVETTIESTIQTLRNTLEYVREQESREREDKILLHRPRQTESLGTARAGLQEALQDIKARIVLGETVDRPRARSCPDPGSTKIIDRPGELPGVRIPRQDIDRPHVGRIHEDVASARGESRGSLPRAAHRSPTPAP